MINKSVVEGNAGMAIIARAVDDDVATGLQEEKSSGVVLKCSDPGMCLARNAHSLRAITNVNLSSPLSNSSSSSSRVAVLIPDEGADVFISCLLSELFSPWNQTPYRDGTGSTQLGAGVSSTGQFGLFLVASGPPVVRMWDGDSVNQA